jgi:hypothetical protein
VPRQRPVQFDGWSVPHGQAGTVRVEDSHGTWCWTRRRRSGGTALALGPFGLIWLTSLNGFYTAELDTQVLRLRYLIPLAKTDVPLTDIAAVEASPWYRGRWRLHVVTTTGQRFESATWDRNAVSDAMSRLKRHLSETAAAKQP